MQLTAWVQVCMVHTCVCTCVHGALCWVCLQDFYYPVEHGVSYEEWVELSTQWALEKEIARRVGRGCLLLYECVHVHVHVHGLM